MHSHNALQRFTAKFQIYQKSVLIINDKYYNDFTIFEYKHTKIKKFF